MLHIFKNFIKNNLYIFHFLFICINFVIIYAVLDYKDSFLTLEVWNFQQNDQSIALKSTYSCSKFIKYNCTIKWWQKLKEVPINSSFRCNNWVKNAYLKGEKWRMQYRLEWIMAKLINMNKDWKIYKLFFIKFFKLCSKKLIFDHFSLWFT